MKSIVPIQYPCGHPPGPDPWCPICEQEEQARAIAAAAKEKLKQQELEALVKDPISLENTPILLRPMVRKIIDGLSHGQHWKTLHGRKLNNKPDVVVFNLGYRYRLLCRIADNGKQCEPYLVLSHEDYNNVT